MKIVLGTIACGALVACAAGSLSSNGDAPLPPAADAGPDAPASPSGAPSIFVSTLGDDGASGATPADALRTIQTAIDRAVGCPGAPCAVLVSTGTYAQPLTIKDGVSVFGGYSYDFAQRDPVANAVTITSTKEHTIDALNLTTTTTIDGVTIVGASLASSDGKSSTALFVKASGASLFVSNATIRGGKGALGAVGGDAMGSAKCDAAGGTGGASNDCGSASGTSGAADGDPVLGGGGGGGGSNDCPDACPLVNADGISDGSNGTPGGDGTSGAGGTASADVTGSFDADGAWAGTLGTSGARGVHGTGGGGGGAGGAKRFRACFGCDTLLGGQGGVGGNGGCGGDGGEPGGAGGASFAVVVVGSLVTLDTVKVIGGTGGNGGAGGNGHDGDPGALGDTGRGEAGAQKCGLINYSSGAGGHGGGGGKGGAGGGGAGGPGGPSIAIVTVGKASVTSYGVSITVGAAGAGGGGGAGPGNVGAVGLPGAVIDSRAY